MMPGIASTSDTRGLTAEGKYMPMPADQIELTQKDFVISPEAISPRQIVG